MGTRCNTARPSKRFLRCPVSPSQYPMKSPKSPIELKNSRQDPMDKYKSAMTSSMEIGWCVDEIA